MFYCFLFCSKIAHNPRLLLKIFSYHRKRVKISHIDLLDLLSHIIEPNVERWWRQIIVNIREISLSELKAVEDVFSHIIERISLSQYQPISKGIFSYHRVKS